MQVEKVSSVSNQSFTSETNQQKQIKTPEEVKDGKKKLALALATTGAIAAAGIGIAVAVKKGKK